MPNKIEIFRYVDVRTKKREIAAAEYVDLAFATRNNKRLVLLVNETGLDIPNAPAVIIEYKEWDGTFRGPYIQPGNIQPFKAYLPDGSKWYVANELYKIDVPTGAERAFMIFKMH